VFAPYCPHEKRRCDASRSVTPLLQKASPTSPLLQHPSFFSSILSLLIIYLMTLPQNNGTLCTVALHPLIPSIDSYMQSPPSEPFRSRSRSPPPPPPLFLRAGVQPPLRPSTPQPYVFSDDADVGRDIAHIIHTHRSVSSSQSLPRTSSQSSSNRKQQATQRPIRQNSSWRTFHSCAACLAL
jgi:hypothetical protein